MKGGEYLDQLSDYNLSRTLKGKGEVPVLN
jgi:hypothetical protein